MSHKRKKYLFMALIVLHMKIYTSVNTSKGTSKKSAVKASESVMSEVASELAIASSKPKGFEITTATSLSTGKLVGSKVVRPDNTQVISRHDPAKNITLHVEFDATGKEFGRMQATGGIDLSLIKDPFLTFEEFHNVPTLKVENPFEGMRPMVDGVKPAVQQKFIPAVSEPVQAMPVTPDHVPPVTIKKSIKSGIGDRVIEYTDGTHQINFKDGRIKIDYPNGNHFEYMIDGTMQYYSASIRGMRTIDVRGYEAQARAVKSQKDVVALFEKIEKDMDQSMSSENKKSIIKKSTTWFPLFNTTKFKTWLFESVTSLLRLDSAKKDVDSKPIPQPPTLQELNLKKYNKKHGPFAWYMNPDLTPEQLQQPLI